MTLYTDLVAAGATITNHASDLHVEVSDEVRNILRRYPHLARRATYRKSDTGTVFHVPGAYDPFWEERRAEAA